MSGAGLTSESLRKASPDMLALKPYRGKPAVRNFREGDGNVGIIRSPVRAITLPRPRSAPAAPRIFFRHTSSPLLCDAPRHRRRRVSSSGKKISLGDKVYFPKRPVRRRQTFFSLRLAAFRPGDRELSGLGR